MTRDYEISIGDIVIVALIIFLELLFFRNVLTADALLGDDVDGRLNTFFSAHWYEWIMGREGLTDMYHMFFPADNVLSYSDMMLGFGILCLPFRLFGMSEFLAFKWVVILGHIIGSLALYYYMRECMDAAEMPSLLSVVAFSFSNQFITASYHTQLYAVSFFPLVMVFFHKYLTKKRRLIYLILTGLSFCMIFYTSFYIGFFAGTCFGIFVLVSAVVYGVKDIREYTSHVADFFYARWKDWLIALILSAAAMIPFVKVYLPTMNKTGGKEYDQVIYTTYDIRQLIFTWWDNESEGGFSFAAVGIAAFFIMLLLICMKKKISPLLLSCVLTLFLAIIPCLHFGEHTLWYVVYEMVPAASAIRAIFRMFFVLSLPFSIILGLMTDELFERQWLPAVLCVLIFAETFSPAGVKSEWSASSQNAVVREASGMPMDCEVFYLYDPVKSEDEDGSELARWGRQIRGQLDAVEIAHFYGVRTVNGYSGNVPEGWDISTTYRYSGNQAATWAGRSGISHRVLYGYDQARGTWKRVEP
ncbi:MAG: glycosyltransferase family 39 protein [Lachnospiraceae bacterium]|nr:glycosyltransferase family 39 protein [Lachnospiraceae bacterium]